MNPSTKFELTWTAFFLFLVSVFSTLFYNAITSDLVISFMRDTWFIFKLLEKPLILIFSLSSWILFVYDFDFV